MIGGFHEERGENEAHAIVLWHGPLVDIPTGWLLCDGNNGTPDLRDRFVKGVGNSPGATGGQNTFSMNASEVPPHSHTGGTTDTVGDHDHGLDYDRSSGSDKRNTSYSGGDLSPDDYTLETTAAGSHTHPISDTAAGGGSTIDNKPPFYGVAFIMKS